MEYNKHKNKVVIQQIKFTQFLLPMQQIFTFTSGRQISQTFQLSAKAVVSAASSSLMQKVVIKGRLPLQFSMAMISGYAASLQVIWINSKMKAEIINN
jgi:TRAP-type mannitol/chloroaromatic compound transport system permease small subunit